jgi:hypothetical protein
MRRSLPGCLNDERLASYLSQLKPLQLIVVLAAIAIEAVALMSRNPILLSAATPIFLAVVAAVFATSKR